MFRRVGTEIIQKKNFFELNEEKYITRLVGTHDAIGAFLIEEAGFEGLWVSSYELHASCRLPDADILSIPDYAIAINRIADRTNLPILVDGDAGGGSPINSMRMVREYEKNGADGICIEDNCYPKRCSFYASSERKLEDPRKHAKKIQAIVENKIDSNFFTVARTETLIVGGNVPEAIDRCCEYVDAGANAVLIHHKGNEPEPVLEFGRSFRKATRSLVPIVAVPTTYSSVTEKDLVDNGISFVIYANCAIRSAIFAQQNVLHNISKSGTLDSAEHDIVNMKEVFRIIDLKGFRENEKRYH